MLVAENPRTSSLVATQMMAARDSWWSEELQRQSKQASASLVPCCAQPDLPRFQFIPRVSGPPFFGMDAGAVGLSCAAQLGWRTPLWALLAGALARGTI